MMMREERERFKELEGIQGNIDREEQRCPVCGDLLERETVNEGTDMDGRRGRKYTYITCSNLECDFEKTL